MKKKTGYEVKGHNLYTYEVKCHNFYHTFKLRNT